MFRTALSALALAWASACVYSQSSLFAARVGGPELANGGRIQVELPGELHRRNTESKGRGLCVFTSIHHAAVYNNIPQLVEFPKWVRDSGIAGGSYPTKTAQLISQISRARGLPEPEYLQVESSDVELLKLACRTGRMVSCTYGLSPTGRYNNEPIAHMVNLVHFDDETAVVLDNNYIGASSYEWMSVAEFRRAYFTVPGLRGQAVNNGKGWSVVLLAPSPPPTPIH